MARFAAVVGFVLMMGSACAGAGTLTPILHRSGVSVFAVAATSQWCRPRVHLLWRARNANLFHRSKRLQTVMHAVAGRLRIECPKARTATIRGVDAMDGSTVYRGRAAERTHWHIRPGPASATP